MVAGIKGIKNPFDFIGIMIAVILITQIATNTFPTIISNLVGLNTLGNFTFSSLFASDGMMSLIVSAIVLIAILVTLGIRTGSKR